MDQAGWIKSWRSMLDHPALQTPTAWTVWTKLLLKAAHKQCRVTWRGQSVPLDAGEAVISERQFARDNGLPYQSTRTALDRFAREGMLKRCSIFGAVKGAGVGAVGIRISICNWAKYQGSEHDGNAVGNAAGNATPTQQQRTEQEGKKERKKESESPSPSSSIVPSASEGTARIGQAGTDLLGEQTGCDKPKRTKRNAYPEAFQQFWLAYPTRGTDTKADAFRAWDKARQAGTDVATLQSGAERYAAYAGSTGCETKHVQAWMNKQGWTASYERKPNGNGHMGRPANQRPSVVGIVKRLNERREQGGQILGDDAPRGEGREPGRG